MGQLSSWCNRRWADVFCWTMSYVWISLQTRWQQQALQRNSKHMWRHTFNLCLEILTNLLTTASSLQCCTARKYQTYMASKAIVGYVWLSAQTCWQQLALNEHSKHTYLQTHDELCGDVLAHLLITSRNAMSFQTDITTKNLWAMWGIPCRLAGNNKRGKEIANIHIYKNT